MTKKKKWEALMLEVDAAIKAANSSLYQRVLTLKAIWDDADFLAFHGGNVDEAEKHLNSKLGDYGIEIFDAFAMLKHFPHESQWSSGSVRQLLAHALEAEEAARQSVEPPKPKKRNGPVSHKDFQQVQQQLNQVTSTVDKFQSENDQLREENRMLRKRVAELEVENAYLRGRVGEQAAA